MPHLLSGCHFLYRVKRHLRGKLRRLRGENRRQGVGPRDSGPTPYARRGIALGVPRWAVPVSLSQPEPTAGSPWTHPPPPRSPVPASVRGSTTAARRPAPIRTRRPRSPLVPGCRASRPPPHRRIGTRSDDGLIHFRVAHPRQTGLCRRGVRRPCRRAAARHVGMGERQTPIRNILQCLGRSLGVRFRVGQRLLSSGLNTPRRPFRTPRTPG